MRLTLELRDLLEASFAGRVVHDWVFVNVSRSSPYFGRAKFYSGKTFREAARQFAKAGLYGKVNKVVFMARPGIKVSCYVSGGVIKHGRRVDLKKLTVYVNDSRIKLNKDA